MQEEITNAFNRSKIINILKLLLSSIKIGATISVLVLFNCDCSDPLKEFLISMLV